MEPSERGGFIMDRLTGKVAIITGAASGMGEAAAELFAREGAKVVATDVVFEPLGALVDRISAEGGDAIALRLDVASEDSWKTIVDLTIAEYGKIDILVNNAGVHVPKGIMDETLDGWNWLMGINCTGVWLGMKAVIPHMQANGKGSIINCSSIAGIMGGDTDGHGAAYSASKGAVRSMTKHAAQWFATDNIRVNSVHPGAVFTGMARAFGINSREEMGDKFGQGTPLPPHAGESMDIAYGYLYLASDESKFVTGEELVIDGGWITH
jgi:NAD(P)-dependent dehydrogenase (short-subunit alcohol dehydrogenase family)